MILLLSLTALSAQNRRGEVEQKLEARRIAFLTQELDLSVSESQQFWPLYNAYVKEQKKLRKKYKKKEDNKMKDADEKLEGMLAYDEEMSALKKTYTKKFKQIIGADKTLKLIKAQRKFREKLLKKVKERRKQKRKGK